VRATLKRLGWALGALALAPATLTAQVTERISMDEAIGLFAENSLALRIARADAEEIQGIARQSKSYFNPALTVVHETLGRGEDDYWETTVGLEQTIEWPGRTTARGRAARYTAGAAGAEFRADSLRLAFDVRAAYAATWAAEAGEAVLKGTAEVIAGVAEDAERRLEEGDISGYDARRLRLERIRIEGDVLSAALASGAARRHLATLVLGDSEITEIGPADPLLGIPPEVPPDAALSSVAGRPDIEAATGALEAARASVSAAANGWITDPTFLLGYKDQADGFSGAALTVALPLPLFDRRGGAADGARARQSAASASLDLRTREARTDVLSASDRYEVTRQRLGRIGDDLVDEAQALLTAAGAAYDEGEMSLLELLDAARAFRDTRLTAVSLTADTWIAYYDLLRAMGRAPEEDR